MFTKHTLFVLGAGVSVPFGFPSGEKLVRILTGTISPDVTGDDHELLEQHRRVLEVLKRATANSNLVEEFVKKLKNSGTPSIDTWLSQNKQFINIGKMAIAIAISDAESRAKEHLYSPDDWYKWLFDRMLRNTTTLGQFMNNTVTFITFNYDRMLEWRIGQYIENFFGDTPEGERHVAIEKFYERIVHVHGHLSFKDYSSLKQNLGDISLSALQDIYGTERQRKLDAFGASALGYSQSVRIIGETFTNDHQYSYLKFTQGAQRIIFLGFGYDVRNLELLRIRDRATQMMHAVWESELANPIIGTAFQMANAQCQDVRAEIHADILLGRRELTCVPFCNEYVSVRDLPLAHDG